MTNTLPDLIELAGERARVGQLPLDAIIEGAERRRRRRAGLIAAAVFSVLATTGGAIVIAQSGRSSNDPTVTADTPTPATVQSNAAEDLALPCTATKQRQIALDIPGPGRPTPEEAVAPYAGSAPRLKAVVDTERRNADVHVIAADGTVVRTFGVTLHDDGWWPDGYAECRN